MAYELYKKSQHMEGYVRHSWEGGIATITFHHPNANQLPSQLLLQLAHTITEVGHVDKTKVIILRSDGDRSFCSGSSLQEMGQIQDAAKALSFFQASGHVINAMRKCPVFIITRVHAKVMGAGLGLVAASDYPIAVEGADVKLSELAVGIGPFVVGPAIERKVGISSYGHLAIDATHWRNSDWAKRKGLYAEHHPSIELMDESIARLAIQLCRNNAGAVQELKKIMWKGTENWDQLLNERAQISARLLLQPFTQQLLRELREPIFN